MKISITITLLLAASLIQLFAGENDVLIIDWMHANGCLAAIAADDYEAFCKQGAPELRKNVPKERFQSLAAELRPRLLDGYILLDKGTLGSFPNTTVLWRLKLHRDAPAGSDEILILMPNSQGKDISDFRIVR